MVVPVGPAGEQLAGQKLSIPKERSRRLVRTALQSIVGANLCGTMLTLGTALPS
jgi:hypothetical protein